MTAEPIREVVDLDVAGQLPPTIYALQQRGTFLDGKDHTHIELTHSKGRLDEAVANATKYGDPNIKYKAVYGVIQWLEEEEIIPDAATKQLTLLPPMPTKRKGAKRK